MSISLGTFHFVLQTPSAKLLDCRAGSVVVPAHDGQFGILRNHMPMLSKLGLGILQVKDIVYEKGRPDKDKLFLVDGGFVSVSENNVVMLAYAVETFEDMTMDSIESIVSNSKKLLAGDKYSPQANKHDIEKASVLLKLAKMAGLLKDNY